MKFTALLLTAALLSGYAGNTLGADRKLADVAGNAGAANSAMGNVRQGQGDALQSAGL